MGRIQDVEKRMRHKQLIARVSHTINKVPFTTPIETYK
jgi:hypothetical protein